MVRTLDFDNVRAHSINDGYSLLVEGVGCYARLFVLGSSVHLTSLQNKQLKLAASGSLPLFCSHLDCCYRLVWCLRLHGWVLQAGWKTVEL